MTVRTDISQEMTGSRDGDMLAAFTCGLHPPLERLSRVLPLWLKDLHARLLQPPQWVCIGVDAWSALPVSNA